MQMTWAEFKNKHVPESLLVVPQDDEIVVLDSGYYADDGNCEVHFPDATSPQEAAQEYIATGDYGEVTRTIWLSARGYGKARVKSDSDVFCFDVETVTEALHPVPPPCAPGCEHEWVASDEDLWVRSHGGGVRILEVCRHCGIYRETDTWATNMQTGEQGLEEISYREAEEQ